MREVGAPKAKGQSLLRWPKEDFVMEMGGRMIRLQLYHANCRCGINCKSYQWKI